VCRSLVDARFGGVTVVSGMGIAANGTTANGGVGDLSSVHGSSLGAADMSLLFFLFVGPPRMFRNSPLLILRSAVVMLSSSPRSCFCTGASRRGLSLRKKKRNPKKKVRIEGPIHRGVCTW
jgi:hypothetical protein